MAKRIRFLFGRKECENLTSMELEFADYLMHCHRGEDNAITQSGLTAEWGDGPTVRKMVNRLRKAGFPVCSGSVGYYFAGSPDEMDETIDHLICRLVELEEVIQALIKVQERWAGDSE